MRPFHLLLATTVVVWANVPHCQVPGIQNLALPVYATLVQLEPDSTKQPSTSRMNLNAFLM